MKKSKFCLKHLIPPRQLGYGMLRVLMVICFLGFFNAMAGQGKLNQLRVSLNVNNIPLIDCFNEIQKQTGIDFVYNEELCKQFGEITLSVRNASIESVLDAIFAGKDLKYRFEDGMIVVLKREQKTLPQEGKSVVISGLVKDMDGNALPGVTVVVKGTSFGVATDEKGHYALEIPDMSNIVLVFSFVGMETQEIPYKGLKEINVNMVEKMNEMEGVVVTGIFNKPKESFTGAAVKVTKEELKMAGNRNILQSLSNIDPSFVLVENNVAGSDPNALPEIRMRGVSSIPTMDNLQSSTRAELCTPLFILDGFEISLEQMMDLNNDEIESITLLKDASSTAMYGSRGANGVVVIKSIEPQAGRLKVSYSGSVNFEIPSLASYDLLNAAEKLQLERDAGYYDDDDLILDAKLKALYAQKYSRVLAGVNTNWLRIPVRVGIGQNHYINVNGGDKSFRYSMGISYDVLNGAMRGSDRSTLNGTLRLSYLTEKFSFNNNFTLGLNHSNQSNYGNFSEYVRMNPYYEPYNQEGQIVKQFELENTKKFPKLNNPLWDASLNSFNRSEYTSFSNNFSVTYNPFKTVQATMNFSYMKRFATDEVFTSPSDSEFFGITDILKKGKRSYFNSEDESWSVNVTVNYFNTWGRHILTAGVNYEARQSDTENRGMKVLGFVNESMNDISSADSYDGEVPSYSDSRSRTIGLAGTVNYSYDNRYFADFSYRIDGSSSFGSNSRWAPFYSMGLGWNINREHFILDNIDWLTLFRIKYSYGASGSQNFSPSQSLGTYDINTSLTYHGGIIATITGLENPDLKWQTTYQHNIGTDISLFENRFSITANWYRKLTKNSITDMALPLSNGFEKYTGNQGDILNTGFDLDISYYLIKNQEKNVMWSIQIGTSHNKNTLLRLSEAVKQNMATNASSYGLYYVYQEGESVDAIYAVPTVGVDPATGKILYLYKDGTQSYKYDVNQRIVCGDRMPKFDGRLSTSFQWKSLSVYAGFTLRLGGQKYNDTYANKVENVDLKYNVDRRVYTDRWKKPGDNSAFYGLNENVSYLTDRYIQDENTFACNNLSITYGLPSKLIKRWGFDRFELNASIGNLFYISTVKQERGTSYPYAIQPSFGLSCSF